MKQRKKYVLSSFDWQTNCCWLYSIQTHLITNSFETYVHWDTLYLATYLKLNSNIIMEPIGITCYKSEDLNLLVSSKNVQRNQSNPGLVRCTKQHRQFISIFLSWKILMSKASFLQETFILRKIIPGALWIMCLSAKFLEIHEIWMTKLSLECCNGCKTYASSISH